MNSKRFLLVLSLVALFLFQGCRETDQSNLRFSHYLHVTDVEVACDSCHGLEKGRFMLPDHENCSVCHYDLFESDVISRSTCGVCHQESDLENIGEMGLDERVSREVFYHSEALGNHCNECHGGILLEDADGRLMTRNDVIRIREQSHETGRSCSQCHMNLTTESLPENHQVNWKKRHGIFAADEESTCSVCHEEKTCKACHMTAEPASHNTLWAINTHGIEGSWNRETCRVCHQDDFCAGCHRDTQPRSHTALWLRRHGANAPANFASCQVCHPKEECQACHRTESPISHTAGWDTMHCITCHNSTPIETGCKVCHAGGIAVHPTLAQPSSGANDHTPLVGSCFSFGCHLGGSGPTLNPAQHIMDISLCRTCHPI